MNNYKIGQMTKTMGVSPHLLKHYEKFKLVLPSKDDTTNYRYYNFKQFGRLIKSKQFRNLGFTIKDTADMINDFSNEDLNLALKHHMLNLENQIEQLQFQKSLTETLYASSCECDTLLDQWFIEMMPAMYILKQSNNLELIEENHSIVEEINLVDHFPITKSVLYMPKENLSGDPFTYHWCLGIENYHLNEYHLAVDERFILINSQRAFVTYLKVAVPYATNQVLFQLINDRFATTPFNCCGDLIGILLKSTHEAGISYEYFKLFIPIQ